MFLHSVSPTGDYTSVDLSALPVWRLGITAKEMEKDKGVTHLALMLSYPANVPSGVNRIMLAAVDTKTKSEAEGIASIGMPYLELEKNRARLHESSKTLFNVEAIRKEADGICAKISQLADLYHGILDACGTVPAESKDLSTIVPSGFKGELEGWKFAVTPGRFDPWRAGPNTFRPANGAQAEVTMASTMPAGVPSIGSPPPVGSKPPPPPTRIPSREARRKEEAAAKAAQAVQPAAPVTEAPSSTTPADEDEGDPPVLTPSDVE